MTVALIGRCLFFPELNAMLVAREKRDAERRRVAPRLSV
jgi:hypothetical protein